jgi:hypothetical protein
MGCCFSDKFDVYVTSNLSDGGGHMGASDGDEHVVACGELSEAPHGDDADERVAHTAVLAEEHG